MGILGIAWRSIRQRPLTSLLTSLSLALGVALVVATLVTAGLVQKAFESGAGLGYNMIVGAKGSPLQLVLNSVYFISKPIENVPWAFYAEFLPAARRADGVDGRFAASTKTAVPICMGDYFNSFRVIGTDAAFFGELTRGDGEPFVFAAGGNFRDDDYFAGVLGATVAAKLRLAVGDTFSPTHGADNGPVHDPFRVVGILARTDTPIDRGVFVNMEGFYLQDGHAKPLPEGVEPPPPPPPSALGRPAPLPEAQREVTAILLETSSQPGLPGMPSLPAELSAMVLRTAINEGRDAQAVLPVGEIRQLLDLFVRPLELLLLLVTAMVVLVSAIGILVSMIGSSLERTRDVAIMRALGARRSVVLSAVLAEAVLLAVGGGLAGWILGHLLVGALGPWISTNAGVSASVLSAAPRTELLLVPGLVLVGIVAALVPAIAAYRTDVARWLQGPG
ncbi:MAG: ABC transporter permease [Planctomycetes bacterium]|nr:ABC transporter permease [Planctomycetota bacterium]